MENQELIIKAEQLRILTNFIKDDAVIKSDIERLVKAIEKEKEAHE